MKISPKKIAILLNSLGIFCSCTLLWLISPNVTISGYKPFLDMGNRTLLVAALVLILVCSYFLFQLTSKYASKQFRRHFNRNRDVTVFVKNIPKMVKMLIKDLKKIQAIDDDLRKKPWFLSVGMPQSGKTSILSCSDLGLKADMTDTQKMLNSLDACTWWISQNAVVLDVSRYENNEQKNLQWNTEKNQLFWRGILSYLKRDYLFHRQNPFNGLIVSRPILYSFSQDKKAIEQSMQVISARLKQVDQTFGDVYPVYLVITKIDQIQGFREFFSAMNEEEKNSSLGFDLPYTHDTDSIENIFNEKFDTFIDYLNDKCLSILDDFDDLNSRRIVMNFPAQLAMTKALFIESLKENLWKNKKKNPLCGVYFTSVKQDGNTCEILNPSTYENFDIEDNTAAKQPIERESFFVKGALERILKFTPINNKKSFWYSLLESTRVLSYILGMIFFCIFFTSILFHYNINIEQLDHLRSSLKNFDKQSKNISRDDTTITSPMTALMEILDTSEFFSNNHAHDFLYMLGYSNRHKISFELNDVLSVSLHTLFLPRLLDFLHNQVSQEVYITTLEDLLNAYIYLGKPERMYQLNIAKILAPEFKNHFDSSTAEKLTKLTGALSKTSLPKSQLDTNLIDQSWKKINTIPVQQRIYKKIHRSHSEQAQLYDYLMPKFAETFTLSGKSIFLEKIFLYSEAKTILSNEIPFFSEQYAKQLFALKSSDNKVVTMQSIDILTATKELYLSHYKIYWHNLVNNLAYKQSDSLSTAIEKLNLLSQSDSPLDYTFDFITSNTKDILSDDVELVPLRKYIEDNNAMQSLRTQFHDLSMLLEGIAQKPNPNQVAFEIVTKKIKGELKNDPMALLISMSDKMPHPLAKIVKSIVYDANNQLANLAKQFINTQWGKEIYPLYKQKLSHRFPVDSQSKNELPLDEFTAFFGPKKRLMSFFNEYILPLTNSNSALWKWHKLDGHAFSNDLELLTFFHQLSFISENFFDSESGNPSLTMTVTPVFLSDNAAESTISYAGASIPYRHGPSRPYPLKWPKENDNLKLSESADLILRDFNGKRYFNTFTGPWAIFRLIQNFSHHHHAITPNHVTLDVKKGNIKAKYKVETPSPNKLLVLNPLNKLTFKKELF